MIHEAKVFEPDDLSVGMTAQFDRAVSEADILTFAQNSGDLNPLHVDAAYALSSNYGARIAHGAFQVGLASALIGMYLPGQNVLLGTINARFPSPLFFPTMVNVRGEITAWNKENLAGQLRVVVRNFTSRTPTAEITMGFTLHSPRNQGKADRVAATDSLVPTLGDRKVILVTGASGGLGEAIATSLAADYTVIALANRQRLNEHLRSHPHVRELSVDLTSPDSIDSINSTLNSTPLYGVVHAAWPGMPRGGLLQAQDDVLDLQLSFGTTHFIRLARLLFAAVDPNVGGRLIAIGSIAGRRKPAISVATYSLGKTALEATVGLLAPEMARKKITVNALCPSYIPVGINKQGDERQGKVEAARVPLGRVCELDDVVGSIRHLLSPAASFLSGEVIGLNGGQL